ncbi:MAG: hypothetical protein KG028_11545 [Actinobacteria bacterium]|jgi:hypothetical protein|nr:hypothetical protein [Actinomycetota bacterium]
MTGNWLVAVIVLALLVYVGMGIRVALLLRRQSPSGPTAWLAGLLAWPLVRRVAAGRTDEQGPADH